MRASAASLALGMLLLQGGGLAYTANNVVPVTKAGASASPIGADRLKPSACSGITLTNLVVGTIGTSGNDLILGTAGADVMSGGDGNDCILGGGGKDTIDGGSGTDVCIGGPAIDIITCETPIQ